MAHFIFMLTPTPTPPPDEAAEQVTRVIDAFSNMTFGMAALFVIALVAFVAVLLIWQNRNSQTAATGALTKLAEDRDKRADEARQERKQELQQIGQAVTVLAQNSTNQTAILERMDKRTAEQAATDAAQAADLNTLVNMGSKPLRDLIVSVGAMMLKVDTIDTRMVNNQTMINEIPLLRAEFNSKLDLLLNELNKRSTKPIPEIAPEASPT